MPATTPATRWRVFGCSGAPKRRRLRQAIGPRAHGEDVAQDAADAGRRALIGLDEGRVVVALHLEDDRVAIADVDDAGVFARALDHPRRGRRELAQVQARGFVGAVLVPHRREDAELGKARRAAEERENALVFVGLQAMRGDEHRIISGSAGVKTSVFPSIGRGWRLSYACSGVEIEAGIWRVDARSRRSQSRKCLENAGFATVDRSSESHF